MLDRKIYQPHVSVPNAQAMEGLTGNNRGKEEQPLNVAREAGVETC